MPQVTVMIKPVSGLCNMHCDYCFYADEMAQRDVPIYQRMSVELLEVLMRRLFAYADDRVFLTFQGGEPTLAGAEFYEELLRLERKYNTWGIQVNNALQTNGFKMDDDMIQVLRKGNFLVGLSMDGTEKIHNSRRKDHAGGGTWDRVQETAEKLKASKIPYNVLCVVDREIAENPREVFLELEKHEYIQFISCLDPLDGARSENSLTDKDYGNFLIETWKLYRERILKGRYVSVRLFDNWLHMIQGGNPESCGLSGCCAQNSFLIESNGNVYPCDFYALDEYLLGNIRETSFIRLAASSVEKRFLNVSRIPAPECGKCEYYSICRGGCRRDREPFDSEGTGKLNRLCEAYRTFFGRYLLQMTETARM